MLHVLGIETSCDETAASVVTEDRRIRSNIVFSQTQAHLPYGGVVPEIAARAHIDHLEPVIAAAMAEAELSFADLDAVAVTAGPGLIGGVIVGVMMAKAIAAVHGKPLVAVNHLEGHALTARLVEEIAFPYLLLLVSGGHCQILAVEGVGRYRRLGGTLDDAMGEAFDKTAKMLGLAYPGGPAVEALAREGDASRFALPRPLLDRPGCDFSFSGLKTAVRQVIAQWPAGKTMTQQDKADLCASFQQAVAEVAQDRLRHAMRRFAAEYPFRHGVVLAGGVAANRFLRERLAATVGEAGYALYVPPPALCTDNGAMIAWAGLERFRLGMRDGLEVEPRARWPLTEL